MVPHTENGKETFKVVKSGKSEKIMENNPNIIYDLLVGLLINYYQEKDILDVKPTHLKQLQNNFSKTDMYLPDAQLTIAQLHPDWWNRATTAAPPAPAAEELDDRKPAARKTGSKSTPRPTATDSSEDDSDDDKPSTSKAAIPQAFASRAPTASPAPSTWGSSSRKTSKMMSNSSKKIKSSMKSVSKTAHSSPASSKWSTPSRLKPKYKGSKSSKMSTPSWKMDLLDKLVALHEADQNADRENNRRLHASQQTLLDQQQYMLELTSSQAKDRNKRWDTILHLTSQAETESPDDCHSEVATLSAEAGRRDDSHSEDSTSSAEQEGDHGL